MLTSYKAVADETNPDEYGCYHVYHADEVVHAAGVQKYGRVIQKKSFNDVSDDHPKADLYKLAAEWLEKQNEDEITTIECSAAELHYLQEYQYGKFQVGQNVTVTSPAHGIDEQVFPMYKISVSLNSGAKKITIGTPPKKELTDIIKSGSSTSTRTTNNSSGSGGNGGGGGTALVRDVKVKFPGDEDFKSSVRSRISRIDMSGFVTDVLAGVHSVKNTNGEAILPVYDVELDGTSIVNNGVAGINTDDIVKGNPLQLVDSGDLRKIKIGNHVFSVPEGGGGSGGDSEFVIEEICSTVTVVNEHNAGRRTDTTRNIPYSDTVTYPNVPHLIYTGKTKAQLTDYDAFVLLLDFGISDLSSNPKNYESFLIFKDTITDMAWEQRTSSGMAQWYNTYSGPYYDFGYFVWSTFDHSTDVYQLAFCATRDNASGYVNIGAVYGIKFGGGGGVKDILVDGVSVVDPTTKTAEFNSSDFGTTVVANPSGTATDDLEKIQIGSTIYDIPSGGGASVYMSDYYSTEERVVGRWTDGKPLHQKTLDLGSNVTINGNTWYNTSISATDVDKVIHTFAGLNTRVASSDAYNNSWDCLGCTQEDGVFKILNARNGQITMRYVTIQYTKTTDAPGTGPTAGNIIYLPTLYSEEEREVGVWTDGKPLYQKTFIFDSTVANNWVKHDITALSIDTLVVCSGWANRITATQELFHPLQYDELGGSNYAVSGRVVKTPGTGEITLDIYNKLSSGNTTDKQIAILQYTKTTDVAGSGTWVPSGQYAHHYSTVEHVIGTWVDGSTLYEITFTTSALSSNSWNEDDLPVSGINKIVHKEILVDELQDNIPYTFSLGSADGGRYEAQFWHNRSNNKYQLYIKTQGNVTDIYATITIQYTKTSS
jgi:hypothetical protein